MTLIRSGVKKIRVIDYDIVTLSSLNRHAFAFRSDVGKLKVRVVKEYVNKINPNIIIESIDDAFIYEYAENYIKSGNPSYIVDCIDDLEAKCGLIKFCQDNNLRIISSMGAGGKMDPTCIKIKDFPFIDGEVLARRMRNIYKKSYNESAPVFKCIYSSEKTKRGLTELLDHQKENPEIYRINENERVRSLPVFASIPAIFGQAIASAVLSDLAQMPIQYSNHLEENVKSGKEPMVGKVLITKLYEDFKMEEEKRSPNNKLDLVYEDFLLIANKFNRVSSISLKDGNKTKFYRWNYSKPAEIDNIVLLTKSEFNKHFECKTEEDLNRVYGDNVFNRVIKVLNEIRKEYNKNNNIMIKK